LHGRPLSDHRAAFLFETRASYLFGDTWQLVMKTAQLRALRLARDEAEAKRGLPAETSTQAEAVAILPTCVDSIAPFYGIAL
jgi:hypothetical protein